MGNTNTTDIEYDYLTGLANRRGLYGYFDTLENDCIVHAMFLDIDNFKRVNDIYGHSMSHLPRFLSPAEMLSATGHWRSRRYRCKVPLT